MADGAGDPAGAAPVVLVTGAGGHIGRALLRRFAEAGWRTVGTDLATRPPEASRPHVTLWRSGDVTSPDDMIAVVEATVGRLGRLDVLVANAGITALGSFDETSDEVFRRVVDVNLHGAVHAVRAALPALRVRGGRVVAMSSVAGFAPVIGRPAYTASKHAVTGLFESLRPELARDGVGVTVVHPSFLATAPADLNRGGPGTGDGRSTTGRAITADDVASAVVRAVRSGRDRVFPGRLARLAHVVHRLSPRLYAWLMRRRLGRS